MNARYPLSLFSLEPEGVFSLRAQSTRLFGQGEERSIINALEQRKKDQITLVSLLQQHTVYNSTAQVLLGCPVVHWVKERKRN